MDASVIDQRKARARTWFEALRDDICAAFERLEVDAPPSLYPGEAGRFEFTATEYLAGEGCGLIHWNVTISDAPTYRGLPTEGKTLTTIGSTFHQFDQDGRIELESTHWEDNGVFVQLGLPIQRRDPKTVVPTTNVAIRVATEST